MTPVSSLVPGLLFRRLAPTDSLEELTELLHRAYAPLAAMGFRFVASHQPVETTRKRIASGECTVGVFEGRLVATATLALPGPPSKDDWYARPDVGRLQQLAVDPALQGRGVGGALMDLVEARARELGLVELSLDTAEGATRLIRLYESRGYRYIKPIDHRPATNYPSVILSLDLRSVALGGRTGIP